MPGGPAVIRAILERMAARRTTSRASAAAFPAIAFVSVLAGCSAEPVGDAETTSSAMAASHDELRAMRPYWEQIAPLCEGYPSKENCEDGDMTLFSGLLCASGDSRGCAAVRAAQAADGRFWRSPRRVDGNLGNPKSFSRDMSMGVLLYLATTRDTSAAQRWIKWIDDNRACAVEKPFGLGCLVRGPHRVCRDDENMTCTITPGLWALMGRVWTHLGLPPHDEMRRWDGFDGDAASLETTFTEPGYELHLKGVAIFLKEILGVSASWRAENAASLVARQPQNPFFRYLAEGASPTVIERMVTVCPRPETHANAPRFQWSWERADEGEAWRKSMGWDCIFLHNLVERAQR